MKRQEASSGWTGRLWRAVERVWRSRPPRQLHLRETLALGERRFLAVVEVEGKRFLIGSSGQGLALLTELSRAKEAGAAAADAANETPMDNETSRLAGFGPQSEAAGRHGLRRLGAEQA